MQGVFFGLMAALTWGAADFFARLATERVGTRRTIFYMQAIGFFCMGLVVLLWPAARPAAPTAGLLLFAAGIGVLNVLGGTLLYRALEIGTVSLVSPISSTFAAIAAGLSIAVGERPGPFQLAGLGVTVLGVTFASIPPAPSEGPRASRRGIAHAVGAALSWGVGFFALRYVVQGLGFAVPVLVSRVVATLLLGAVAGARKTPLPAPAGAWLWIAGVAVFDSAAFIFYNLGIAGQLTAVVSILSSLFSAVTVMLALVFLKERMSAAQWAAVGVIFVGVALVSSGG